MNDCADAQAGMGASRAQLPPNVAKSVEDLMDRAIKVHKRLAEVAQTRFGEQRKEFVKPPRPGGPLLAVPDGSRCSWLGRLPLRLKFSGMGQTSY